MESLTIIDTNALARTSSSPRNANIDAIRGLAVLGILFMNIYYFGNSSSGYASHEISPPHDIIIELFSNFFLESRFITLFSMLFGVSLAIQLDKLSEQHKNVYQLMKARLTWLIVFGAIHGIFIWSGDVLYVYGLSGFVALCYLKLEPGEQIKKAIVFITAPILLLALINILEPEATFIRGSKLFEEEYLIWSGAYAEQLKMQFIAFIAMAFVTPLILMWLTAGLMLLGVALYRKGIFEQGFNHRQLAQLAVSTLLLSSVDSLLALSSSPVLNNLSSTLVIVSAIPMALIYIHILVKTCRNSSTILIPMQKIGKLSLSLYILQSICGVLLFRHFSPTLVNTLDRPDYMLIAIGFSIFQVILASVYLKYFNQGPLEILWRKLAGSKTINVKETPIVSTLTQR